MLLLVDTFELRPPAENLVSSYRRAEDMPDDDDVFWLDVAYAHHLIGDYDYERLFGAVVAEPYWPFMALARK